ncbi:hypothetical protein B0T16DRAFT_181243 [Cercophora newfieldiana]|uniref:Uncharacterized protein n=1 Tax=Cercophora newfieldiana TaxID=92897 RepID=A0AA40CLZ5_9PEZI|nr:hypothetical protein B0T16DRAFT_181243 [Cercophora newfieldiana]
MDCAGCNDTWERRECSAPVVEPRGCTAAKTDARVANAGCGNPVSNLTPPPPPPSRFTIPHHSPEPGWFFPIVPIFELLNAAPAGASASFRVPDWCGASWGRCHCSQGPRPNSPEIIALAGCSPPASGLLIDEILHHHRQARKVPAFQVCPSCPSPKDDGVPSCPSHSNSHCGPLPWEGGYQLWLSEPAPLFSVRCTGRLSASQRGFNNTTMGPPRP